MQLKDARHLSPDAQEALRYRVVNAVENGMSKAEAASRSGRKSNHRLLLL